MIKNLVFRCYAASDKDACLELFDENTPEFFAPNERPDYASFLDSCPDKYELCFIDDSIAGAFGLLGNGLHRRSLNWILLSPARQGLGIGTAIMSRVMDLARSSNLRLVEIAASHKSAPFFAKFGAIEVSVTDNGWGPGMHRVDMVIDPTPHRGVGHLPTHARPRPPPRCGAALTAGVTLALLSAACSMPTIAAPGAGAPLRLPLTIVQSNPATTISVGDQAVSAIVDTGGGGVTLGAAVIRGARGRKLAGYITWQDLYGRESRSPKFEVPSITIGGQTFRNVVVTQAINYPDGEGPSTPNQIGREFISQYFVIIDYAGRSMTLWPTKATSMASTECGVKRLRMERTKDPGLVVTQFMTPSGPLRAAWDTGSTYSIVPESLAKNRQLMTVARGPMQFYRLGALTAAGHDLGSLEFVVLPVHPPDDFQVVLGANFFANHVVCLDYKSREVLVR